jgi:hypothetical protein
MRGAARRGAARLRPQRLRGMGLSCGAHGQRGEGPETPVAPCRKPYAIAASGPHPCLPHTNQEPATCTRAAAPGLVRRGRCASLVCKKPHPRHTAPRPSMERAQGTGWRGLRRVGAAGASSVSHATRGPRAASACGVSARQQSGATDEENRPRPAWPFTRRCDLGRRSHASTGNQAGSRQLAPDFFFLLRANFHVLLHQPQSPEDANVEVWTPDCEWRSEGRQAAAKDTLSELVGIKMAAGTGRQP